MISPSTLWNFLKTCTDTDVVGRVCRKLGRQEGVDVSPLEQTVVDMIANDSGWMDEYREKSRDRNRFYYLERKVQERTATKRETDEYNALKSQIDGFQQDSNLKRNSNLKKDSTLLHTNNLSNVHNKDKHVCVISASEMLIFFEEFWKSYPGPRKVDKKKCQEKYLRILDSAKDPVSLNNEIMESLEKKWKRCDTWIRDEGKYIRAPMVWLNNENWKDDPGKFSESRKSDVSNIHHDPNVEVEDAF